MTVRAENKEKVIDALKEILPLLKIIGQDDQKGFEKKLQNLWLDPDDLTNDVIAQIKNILTEAGLL